MDPSSGSGIRSAGPSACEFPPGLRDGTGDAILYKGDGRGVASSAKPSRFQRKPPHLDYAGEFKATGSHAQARTTIATLSERHKQLQVAQEEAFERDQRADKFTATFAETRLATCGAPTLNTKSVLIERQRRKADKPTAKVAGGPLSAADKKAAELLSRSTRIQEAIRRAYGSQTLDLKALELIHIPPEVFSTMLLQLARLIRTVNVSRNGLREIPPAFCRAFVEAETLIYKENALDQLPATMSELSYLKHLNAECNQLMTLPIHLSSNLETLHVGRNRLQQIPNVHELTRLVELDLSYNLLQLLPSGMMALTSLKKLNLAGNRLVTLATLPRLLRTDDNNNDPSDQDPVQDIESTANSEQKAREEQKLWRIEIDPVTNSSVYFHLTTKQVTRIKPQCFQVHIPTLVLPNSAGTSEEAAPTKKQRESILKEFPEGWEIVLGDATSTQIQYRNHCQAQTFSSLPPDLDRIGSLTRLHFLNVSGNQLLELPPSIGNLVRLHRLEAENNHILSLPDVFHNLRVLETIKLSLNALTTLPQSFASLAKLTELDVKLNRLQNLPANFGDIPCLKSLDLSSNALESLPSSFLKLKKLDTLKLQNNPQLTSNAGGFTPEALASGDIDRIMWQLQHKLQCELRGAQPPVPTSRIIGVGNESWTTDFHINREFKAAIKTAETTLCLDFHWKKLALSEFPQTFFTNLSKLRELRLSGHQLETIPASFSFLSELRILQLRKNNIRALDDDLFTSPAGQQWLLEEMDVEYNELTSLPPSLGNLRQLRILRAANNQLTDLPLTLGDLSAKLREVYLAHNRLEAAPHVLGALASLEHLDVSYNHLRTLGTMVFEELTKLHVLRASGNQLNNLPQSLGQAVALEELSIAGNQFVEFPTAILLLSATLKHLQLQSNKIFRLPFEFGDMEVLETVATDGNPFWSPPPEIMRLGVRDIQAYLRKRQERVNEISVLLETLGLSFDRDVFVLPKLQHLLITVGDASARQIQNGTKGSLAQTAFPFLTDKHLAAFDRAVDRYVNGAFYLYPTRRGADLVNASLFQTHFSLAQLHYRRVLDDLIKLCELIRTKRWADKIDFRFDLERPWGRRGELVGVYMVNPTIIFDDQPRLPSILSVIRTRVHHGFEQEAFTRGRHEVEVAIDQYVGVYGPIGIVHDEVPFNCGCEELLQYNKMHSPCYRPGWTFVQVLFTEEEAARRVQDEQKIVDALHALRPQIETFLCTEEGEKRFHREVKEIKTQLRLDLRALEKKLIAAKKKLKAKAQELEKDIKADKQRKKQQAAAERAKSKSKSKSKSKEPKQRKESLPAPPMTLTEVKEHEEQQDQVKRLEERVATWTKELEAGKQRLGSGYSVFMNDVVTKLLERVGTEVKIHLTRQQREKAIQRGWRRPWDGPCGRDFEKYKKLVRRTMLGDGSAESEDHGDGSDESDNSEISDVVFEEYDDLVVNNNDQHSPMNSDDEDDEAELAALKAAALANIEISDVSDDDSDRQNGEESQDSDL